MEITIPLYKKEFKVVLILFETLVVALLVAGIVLFLKYQKNQATPAEKAELESLKNSCKEARHALKNKDLWESVENEADLIAKTVKKQNFAVYARFENEKETEEYFIYGGNLNKTNATVRQSLSLKLQKQLITILQKEENSKITSIILELPEEKLIDANMDGVWDNQPSK